MYRLTNTVRPYAWGSTNAIPELLGTEPTGEPQAEMWMGAHPGAPSRIATDTIAELPLNEFIDADPLAALGAPAVDRFGPRLPFLLKILAAGSPSPSRSTPTSPRLPASPTRSHAASRSVRATATTRMPTTSPR